MQSIRGSKALPPLSTPSRAQFPGFRAWTRARINSTERPTVHPQSSALGPFAASQWFSEMAKDPAPSRKFIFASACVLALLLIIAAATRLFIQGSDRLNRARCGATLTEELKTGCIAASLGETQFRFREVRPNDWRATALIAEKSVELWVGQGTGIFPREAGIAVSADLARSELGSRETHEAALVTAQELLRAVLRQCGRGSESVECSLCDSLGCRDAP
jgi:hypothetical protein